jgi:hypothetical protein
MKVNSPQFVYEPTGLDSCIFPVFVDEKPNQEELIFTNLYPDMRRFFLVVLSNMNQELRGVCKKVDSARVSVGSDIGTLFAADILVDIGFPFDLALTQPADLGGQTDWAKAHPLMMNRLMTKAIRNAQTVTIYGKDHYELLPKAFPRIKRGYLLKETK